MNHFNFNTKQKQKHLNFEHYEFIQHQLKHFEISIKTNKTLFMKQLAQDVGTSLGNLYKIIKVGTVTISNSDLSTRQEFSARAAFNARRKHGNASHNLKLHKVSDFLEDVCNYVLKHKKICSIDEAVNIFKHKYPHAHVCTKTVYNYVHAELIQIKKMDCLEIVGRKQPRKHKKAKRHKGTSIDLRPPHINDRSEFGHWEGDLIVGGRDAQTGALLTLLERQTRFEITIPIKKKTSKQVFMAINKLEKQYADAFPKIFKSITFDNGSEFSRFKDIEKHPKSKTLRTKVYFAHPYASWERGSNENANKLIRRFFPKGTNFNSIQPFQVQHAISLINNKKRRILGYSSAKELFDYHVSLISA